MSKRKHVKPGYVGPAFHEWLQHLEVVEAIVHDRKLPGGAAKRFSKSGYSFNDRLWAAKDGSEVDKSFGMRGRNGTFSMNETIYSMMPVDAWLAHLVRSSVKYRCPWETMTTFIERYGNFMDDITSEMTMHMPYEPVTVCFEDIGGREGDVCVMNITSTTATERSRINDTFVDCDYPSLGIEKGDEFYSVSMCLYRAEGVEMTETHDVDPTRRLSMVPVEIHFNKGLPLNETKWINAIAPGVQVTPLGARVIDLVRQCLIHWLATFQLQGVLRTRHGGIGPQALVAAARRRKPKHRSKFAKPMYEHFVVEFEIDEPEPGQTGITRAEHRKRLHQVRTHWRTCKSGKRVLVSSHWRGNKDLGIVRKDFEMTTHDQD